MYLLLLITAHHQLASHTQARYLDAGLLELMTANDPGNQYAVPYMYGTVLIGFNPNKDGMPLVGAEIRDNPGLTPTAEAQKTLYVLQPLPQKIERVRTRVWNTIKSGT